VTRVHHTLRRCGGSLAARRARTEARRSFQRNHHPRQANLLIKLLPSSANEQQTAKICGRGRVRPPSKCREQRDPPRAGVLLCVGIRGRRSRDIGFRRYQHIALLHHQRFPLSLKPARFGCALMPAAWAAAILIIAIAPFITIHRFYDFKSRT
jgi:hypothetical protein